MEYETMRWIRRGLPYHPIADLGIAIWLIFAFWGTWKGFLIAVGLALAISIALSLSYRLVDCERCVRLRHPVTGKPTYRWVRQSALARRQPDRGPSDTR